MALHSVIFIPYISSHHHCIGGLNVRMKEREEAKVFTFCLHFADLTDSWAYIVSTESNGRCQFDAWLNFSSANWISKFLLLAWAGKAVSKIFSTNCLYMHSTNKCWFLTLNLNLKKIIWVVRYGCHKNKKEIYKKLNNVSKPHMWPEKLPIYDRPLYMNQKRCSVLIIE